MIMKNTCGSYVPLCNFYIVEGLWFMVCRDLKKLKVLHVRVCSVCVCVCVFKRERERWQSYCPYLHLLHKSNCTASAQLSAVLICN